MTVNIAIMDAPVPIRIKQGDEIVDGFLIYVEETEGKVKYAIQCSDGELRFFNNCYVDED